jgi:2-octaprenyl-6-methoxyphenol hydroxylase
MSRSSNVIVVGGGPAGLTAAIALAAAGIDTALVAPDAPPDARTTALLASSVTALETLGAWDLCRGDAAPLRKLRLVDDTGRLLRAPEVTFDSGEIGLDAFGHNIANRHLLAALEARAGALAALHRHHAAATAVTAGADAVTVTLASGEAISAPLVIGADGRRSLCRDAAGIATDRRAGAQTALALRFAHSRPHHDISTEFHTSEGPFTTVPLPGEQSSLVWVLGPGTARRVAAWDDATLSAAIERRAHSILGRTTVSSERGVFPLTIETARRFAAHRIALIGEAAHVMPPIGAQGLNLGLRDAAQIAELVAGARRNGADVGADDLLVRYDALRRPDVATRMLAVDLLNRSLITDFLPVQSARGMGVYILDRIGPLRRRLMREGVTPSAAEPSLMRGEPLPPI